MEGTLSISTDINQLAEAFAKRLAEGVNQTGEDRTFTMALSGGSTPREVFKLLSSRFAGLIPWKRISIFWSDERCVPPWHSESNYGMAKESLLKQIPVQENQIFRIRGERDPADEAFRYAKIVEDHVPVRNQIPRFDMLLLGLGEDGHTASIFPGHLHLFSDPRLFARTEHPVTGQARITMCGRIINNAHQVVFLVRGQAKAGIVARVINGEAGSEELPASWIKPHPGERVWLLDQSAASQLDPRLQAFF